MDFKGFISACYKRSEPSVDLSTVEGMINPSEHKLKLSVYDEILEEFDVKPGTDEYLGCSMWMINQGPLLVY